MEISNSIFIGSDNESAVTINSSSLELTITKSRFGNLHGCGAVCISALLKRSSELKATISDNIFANNSDGALSLRTNSFSNINITNSIFQNNTSGHGAAIYFNGYAKPISIINCTFHSNSALNSGGGAIDMMIVATRSTITVADCMFQNNTASKDGGVVSIELYFCR